MSIQTQFPVSAGNSRTGPDGVAILFLAVLFFVAVMPVNKVTIALLTGYHLCGIWVADGRVWGRRHLFLLGKILDDCELCVDWG